MRRGSRGAAIEALGFWAITLGICLLAGVVSYHAGKHWVGRQLAKTFAADSRQPQPAAAQQDEKQGREQEPPPAQVKVEMEPRAIGEAEQKELTAAAGETSPQETAEEDETSPPDTSPGSGEGTTGASTPPTPSSTGGGYVVTAGSYTVAANADRVKADLEAQGYHPHVTEVEQRGVKYHRVVVGEYADRARAEETRRKLEQGGFVTGLVSR